MTRAAITRMNVRKGTRVWLRENLPQQFGNKNAIRAFPLYGTQSCGEVTSNGWEGGVLKVYFRLYAGDERTQFNALSAEKYLEGDPFAVRSHGGAGGVKG